jgi:hypothetical protein
MFRTNLLLVLISLSLLSLAFTKTYPRYNSCDSKWANDPLFQNYEIDRPTNYTICNDEGFKDGKTGSLFTAFANAFNAAGSVCDYHKECTPKAVNRITTYCVNFDPDRSERACYKRLTKLESLEIRIEEIENFIGEYELVGVTGEKNVDHVGFNIIKIDGLFLVGINREGKDFTIPRSSLVGMVFAFKLEKPKALRFYN